MHEDSSVKFTIMGRMGRKCVLFLILVCVGALVGYRTLSMDINESRSGYLIPSSPQAKNTTTCLKKYFQSGIDKLQHNINTLFTCSSLYKVFSSLYEVSVYNVSQKFGQEFSKKMSSWFGDDSALLELAKFQRVIIVHDILMQRTTVFNPLRSKRPVSGSRNSMMYLKDILESSKADCDFCKPFNSTAEDVFGRILGKYSVSASNAFKLARWHGLFITFEHSIFDINIDIFLDMFNTSLKWFKKVHSIDRNAKYPVFIWDAFPHAGASQVHMHAQGMLGEGHYPGEFEDIIRSVQIFQQKHSTHYWDAVIELYETLGLAFRLGKTSVIAPLVPRTEHELWLLSNEPSSEFYTLLYGIVKMYQEKLERYCFSLAGALPTLGQRVTDPEQSLPSMIVIGSRGDCSSSRNDVSSLELYLFSNVNTDPYKTIAILKQYLKGFLLKYNIKNEMENLWSNSPPNPE